MQVVSLGGYPGTAIGAYGSVGATFARIADFGPGSAATVVRVGPDGVLGLHPAPKPQLMIVIDGEGRVGGEDPASINIRPGVAIRWNAGEQHETRADHAGLVLLILEAEDPNLGFEH
jgi:quercetin dioxygenase-like cupin family protein